VLACLLFPMAGSATSPKDIKIGLHVIDFVTNPPAGRNTVGVIYDSKVKESADDAQAILDSLKSAMSRSGAKAELIDIHDIDDAAGLRAIIVADHMKPYYDRLAAYGRHVGVLTISTDLECVRASKCTVGIASAPRVEVIVSAQQAQASGIQFSEAFRMMVTEY